MPLHWRVCPKLFFWCLALFFVLIIGPFTSLLFSRLPVVVNVLVFITSIQVYTHETLRTRKVKIRKPTTTPMRENRKLLVYVCHKLSPISFCAFVQYHLTLPWLHLYWWTAIHRDSGTDLVKLLVCAFWSRFPPIERIIMMICHLLAYIWNTNFNLDENLKQYLFPLCLWKWPASADSR